MIKKKGISLIVLIITIIVMIIVATVIITSLTDSGIIDKAKEAKNKMNLKQMEEAAKTAFSEVALDKKETKYINGNDLINKMKENGITSEQLADYYILCTNGEVIVENVKRREVTKEEIQMGCVYEPDSYEGFEDGLTYLDDESMKNYGIEVKSPRIINDDTIIIPSKIGDHEIDNVFVVILIDNIKKIYVSDGIKRILLQDNYGSAEIVYLPQSVEAVQLNMYGLKSITIPDKTNYFYDKYDTYFGIYFADNVKLESVTIPSSVTEIGCAAFISCTSLKNVTIPNSVTSIGQEAFSYCTSLKSVIIPNSVTEIGEAAFRNCENLTSIIIPNSVTSIGLEAFAYCTSLKNITVGSEAVKSLVLSTRYGKQDNIQVDPSIN